MEPGGFDEKNCLGCARDFARNYLDDGSSLYSDVFKTLTDKNDAFVCQVLSTARDQGVKWKDNVRDFDDVLDVFLYSERGVQVFEECLRVPQFLKYVRARRKDLSIFGADPRKLDTVPHALAHRGRADLIQVLRSMNPEDGSLKVRTPTTLSCFVKSFKLLAAMR